MATQKLNIFPNDREGQFALIGTTLPVGATVDNIFYLQDGSNYYKRIIDGDIRASHCGIFANGISQSARFQAAVSHPDIQELVLDYKDGTIVINSNVTIPEGFKLIFKNNCKISGSGSITGGIVVAKNDQQIFDTDFVVTGLLNKTRSVAWWGAKRDGVLNSIGRKALQAAINSGTYLAGFNSYKIIFPSSPSLGDSFFGIDGTIDITHDITIEGEGETLSPKTKLFFPQNTVCFNISAGGTARVVMKNILIQQQDPTTYDITKHGVITDTFIYFDNVRFINIAGNGLHIVANAGTGSSDHSRIDNCYFSNCNIGCYIDGSDANIMNFNNNDFTGNRRWGYYSNGFLGNIQINSHFASNGSNNDVFCQYGGFTWVARNLVGITNIGNAPADGSAFWEKCPFTIAPAAWDNTKEYFSGGTYAVININAKELLLNPYQEYYQGRAILNSRSIRIGGLAEDGGPNGGVNMTALDGVLLMAKNALAVGKSVQVGTDLTVGNDATVTGNLYATRACIGDIHDPEILTVGAPGVENEISLRSSAGNKLFLTSYGNLAVIAMNRKPTDGNYSVPSVGAPEIRMSCTSTGAYWQIGSNAPNSATFLNHVQIGESGIVQILNLAGIGTRLIGAAPDGSLGIVSASELEPPTKINVDYFKEALASNFTATDNAWIDVLTKVIPIAGVWQLNSRITIKQNTSIDSAYISYRLIDTTNNIVIASGSNSPNAFEYNSITLNELFEAGADETAVKLQVKPTDNAFVQVMDTDANGDVKATTFSGFRIGDYTP